MRHPISIWKCAILLSIFLLMFSPLSAQRYLTGTVTHAENGKPIPGASVLINGQNTIASTRGKFLIDVSKVFEQVPTRFQILIIKEGYETLIQQVSASQQDDEWRIVDPLQMQAASTKSFVGAMYDDSTGQLISGIQALMTTSEGIQLFEGNMDQVLKIPVNTKMGRDQELVLSLSHPDYHTQKINILPDLDGYEVGLVSMRQSYQQAPGEVRIRIQASEEKLVVSMDGLEAEDQSIRLRLYHKGNPIDKIEIENSGYIGSEVYVWPLSQETKWKGKGYQIHAENLNTLSESFSIGKSSKALLPILIGAGAVLVGGIVYLIDNRKLSAFPTTIPE